MKTLTAFVQQESRFQTTAGQQFVPAMTVSIRETLALLSAVTAAVAIVLFSVWASGQEVMAILGAGTWGVGFIFLAMAVDSRQRMVGLLQASTGMALFVLAWLQNTVSPEFTIFSGVIMAAWISVGLFSRLR